MSINSERLYENACEALRRACVAVHDKDEEAGNDLYKLMVKEPEIYQQIMAPVYTAARMVAETGRQAWEKTTRTAEQVWTAVERTAAQAAQTATRILNPPEPEPEPAPEPEPKPEPKPESSAAAYIGNKNSFVFHDLNCGSVTRMKDKNKVPLSSRDEAISRGFDPCDNCKP